MIDVTKILKMCLETIEENSRHDTPEHLKLLNWQILSLQIIKNCGGRPKCSVSVNYEPQAIRAPSVLMTEKSADALVCMLHSVHEKSGEQVVVINVADNKEAKPLFCLLPEKATPEEAEAMGAAAQFIRNSLRISRRYHEFNFIAGKYVPQTEIPTFEALDIFAKK